MAAVTGSPAGAAGNAAPAGPGGAAPGAAISCTCRAGGRDYRLGETACIRGRVARCDKVLNNTSWKIEQTPCPVSAAGWAGSVAERLIHLHEGIGVEPVEVRPQR